MAPPNGVEHLLEELRERDAPKVSFDVPDEAAPKAKAKAKGKAKATKAAEASRRRKIEAEVRSRSVLDKDVFALQQQLLPPAVSASLMEAACGLLQPEDYQAIVDERGTEGLCGFPPCSRDAAGAVEGKKWSVDRRTGSVLKAEELSNFCSSECRHASKVFAGSLQPDAAYLRPAAAVAASRGAIAAEAKTAAAGEVAEDGSKSAIPKVRQKAVVKFSRSDQSYTVQYDEYDGGGAIPGVDSAEVEQIPNPSKTKSRSGAGIKKDTFSSIMSAPIVERIPEETRLVVDDKATAETRGVGFSVKDIAPKTLQVTESLAPLAPQLADSNKLEGDGGATDGNATSDDGDEDFFEGLSNQNPVDLLPPKLSSFARAWEVLASWSHDRARDALWRGILSPLDEQDEQPDRTARRQMLIGLLVDRVPGSLSCLSQRLTEVVGAFQLHEALPSITEMALYDLLTALLLRTIWRADVKRGLVRDEKQRETELSARLETAARCSGIDASALRALEVQLGTSLEDKNWSLDTTD